MKSPMFRVMVLVVLVAFGIALPLRALGPRDLGAYSFKTYGSDQGLRNLAVSALLQDRTGFVWVGTEDGLYRYDGQAFERFGTKEGLPSASINSLRPGPDGAMWVSTQNKGTGLFKNHQWRALRDFGGVPVGVPLSDLACDGLGRSWLASDTGLFMAPPKGPFAQVKELPSVAVSHLWADPRGSDVYALLKSGKLEHLLPTGQWEGRVLPPGFPRGPVTSMLRDAQGRIWMRGMDWIQRIDGLLGEARDLSAHLPGAGTQGNNLVLDPLGRVWTPSDAGLVCFDGDSASVVDESRGFPGHWAGSLLIDQQGSLWVASEGVSRLQGRFLWTAFTRKQGLPSDIIWAVRRGADGILWVGTQKGLAAIGPKGTSVLPGTSGMGFSSLGQDAEGGLWGGINTLSGSKTTFLIHRVPGRSGTEQVPIASVQGSDQVLSLAGDPGGGLWVGTGSHGLHRLMRGAAGWHAEAVKLPQGAADESINQILAARGSVFVGGSSGLAILEGGSWSRIGTAQGLRDAAIQCLVDAGEGELLATYANIHGIARLSRRDGVWKVEGHLDQPEALSEDNILSAGMDANHVLWLGTSQGVKRWDGKRMEQFLRSDGLPGEDADGNALWVEPDGVWVGFSNGLGHFDGRSYRGQPVPPDLEFLGIEDGAHRSLQADQGLLSIPYRDRTMSFRFAALSFLNESQVRLQVRLLGFEDEWRDTTVREARYTGLPPGLYQFQVRAALGQGSFGPAEIAEFRVLAPWWRTWWFILFGVLSAAGIVVAAVRWRTAILLKQTQQLEALVQERTRDLKEANSALSHMNRALEEASMVDALTGLKNRRYLALHMPEETARVLRAYRTAQALHQMPSGEDLVLLLVDLDHFKSINDTHGHGAGDLVLKQAADTIRKACRVVDTVARWGGEEFLVIARRADRENADTIARNIRDRVAAEAFDLGNGQTTGRTCSVGFAVYPLVPGDPNAFSWEEVLEVADQCLYAAKKSGRNAWVGVYSNAMVPDAELGKGALGELPAMVAEGRLELRTSFPEEQALTWKDHVWE